MDGKKGTVKLAGWKPQTKPDEAMCKRLRQYIRQAVFSYWNQHQRPALLMSIYFAVSDRITKERELGNWPWQTPGKRTIDRRVNEAADPRFYDSGVPMIVAVTAGEYRPNPSLFEESK